VVSETTPDIISPRSNNAGRLPLVSRCINLLIVLLPMVGLVWAIGMLWGWGFHWIDLGLLVGMYLLTGLGITIGYHRLFAHRSFATSKTLTALWAILGSMAVEGPVIRWVATHRSHHKHSDHDEDPHSPNTHGAGIMNTLRGLLHAHVGWIFYTDKHDLARYVVDFKTDKLILTISKLFPLWVLLSLLIPTAIAGLVTMSWSGAAMGLLWGGLVRILVVHHITWSINSVCHIWGWQPFNSGDKSRNNPIFGVLGFGEGWHNNHHAFPASARHGLHWWQLDVSYIIIRTMAIFGLAWNVKVPNSDRIAAKKREG
jgi:stearoyl-CoA desaturase (delta-9 desaturase)